MRTTRPPRRSSRLALALCLGAFAAGCGTEKPVGDAEKLHPNGIGIENEAKTIPGRPKS